MRRVSTVLVLGVVAGSLASADIQFHDFGFKERRRSAKVAQLILDAKEKYPELNALESRSSADERRALLALGRRLAEFRLRFDSAGQIMVELFEELESGNLDRSQRDAKISIVKIQIQNLQPSIVEVRAISTLAKRAFDLAKTYTPAQAERRIWRKTWRTAKTLIPKHL